MAEGFTVRKSRISGNRSAQNPSPTENQVDPGESMESMGMPMGKKMGQKNSAPAHDGGTVSTEEA